MFLMKSCSGLTLHKPRLLIIHHLIGMSCSVMCPGTFTYWLCLTISNIIATTPTEEQLYKVCKFRASLRFFLSLVAASLPLL